MIRTVADFLQQLMDSGSTEIDASGVEHRPTIGEMYEGLTQDLLGRAVPNGAELQLVSGFATDGMGKRSGQLDCMLVRGEGTPLPFSDKYVWHVRDVIAVFEVKKAVTKPILEDAFEHLAQVSELERSYWASEEGGSQPYDPTLASRTFAQLTKQLPRLDDLESMAIENRMIWSVLLKEYMGAVRVLLGYNGWSTENAFRSALVGILEDHVDQVGYGVSAFPQLIVAGGHSIIKANGQPFTTALVEGEWWPFYFSSDVNPLLMLLEVLWTRLDILYGLSDAWGEDLEVERLHPFLLARGELRQDTLGWNYRFLDADSLRHSRGTSPFEAWMPSILTEEQFILLQRLAQGERVRLDDENLLKHLDDQSVDVEEFWESLLSTFLVARSADGTEIELITRECVLAIDPDLGYIAAENSAGHLARWMASRRATDGRRSDPE